MGLFSAFNINATGMTAERYHPHGGRKPLPPQSGIL